MPHISIIGAPDYKQPSFSKLKFASCEIENIEEKYCQYRSIIAESRIGKEATEENFFKLASSLNAERWIFHIVCHGNFDSYEPMNSGLFLACSTRASAEEISNTLIKYNEVVLSACSTGMRSTQFQNIKLVADDIVGLPGVFLEAGTKSILVSISPADDSAACSFMNLYHQNRLKGMNPLFVLQETQKDMLKNYHSPFPPHKWIGFIIYGCQ